MIARGHSMTTCTTTCSTPCTTNAEGPLLG